MRDWKGGHPSLITQYLSPRWFSTPTVYNIGWLGTAGSLAHSLHSESLGLLS